MATPSPVFPAGIATDAQLKVAANQVQTALTVGLSSSATIIFVNSTTGFVANGLVSIDNEVIAISSVVAGPNPSLLVASGGRGYDGTSAAAHSSGAKVLMLIDAWHHNVLAAEIKAIEGALGPGLGNISGGAAIYLAKTYTFTPQAPGGSLIVGANTITLSPVPAGVNGSDVNHYLYVSGGTGTAEPVKIIGGSAVAGAASGTLIVQCANTHSGAWTIQTATGGGAEAHQAVVTSALPGIVQFTVPVTFYQGIYATNNSERVTFAGLGRESILISRATTYSAGDLFHVDVGASWFMQDLGMANGTGAAMTGCGIYIKSGQIQATNVGINNGQYGYRLLGSASSTFHNCTFVNVDMSFKAAAGWSLEASDPAVLGSVCTNIFFSDCLCASLYNNANAVTAGLRLWGADGVWLSSSLFSADAAIAFNPQSNYIANIYMVGGGVDGAHGYSVLFVGGGFQMLSIRFSGVHLNSQGDGVNSGISPCVYVDASVNGLESVSFVNCDISGSGVEGVLFMASGTRSFALIGCEVSDNNVSNTASKGGITLASGVTGVVIENCTIGNTLGKGHQKFGIAALGTATANIQGNNLTNNETAPAAIGPFTGIFKDNRGIDDTVPTVSSAATVGFPLNPRFFLSGNVAVNAVSGLWEGASGSFIATSATPGAWTAGATIGNTFTPTTNVPVSWTFAGGKVYLK